MFDRRLLIVSGKGGVGKSAVAAALAHLAARDGRSVLVVAMTDAVGLASHLGLDHLRHGATRVRDGVEATAVDRTQALDDYLRLQLRLPRAAPIGQFTRVFRVLVDTVPGVREIISMGKPIQDVWAGSHDLVIVDAPPLGQLFSYLSAPETISRLVPSGAVREQAARMQATLADPAVAGLVLVTILDELPALETAEAVAHLHDAGVINLTAVVANRVLESLPVDQSTVLELPAGPLGDAARHHSHLVASQERWSKQLDPTRRVPFFFGRITPPQVTDLIAASGELP